MCLEIRESRLRLSRPRIVCEFLVSGEEKKQGGLEYDNNDDVCVRAVIYQEKQLQES